MTNEIRIFKRENGSIGICAGSFNSKMEWEPTAWEFLNLSKELISKLNEGNAGKLAPVEAFLT